MSVRARFGDTTIRSDRRQAAQPRTAPGYTGSTGRARPFNTSP